MTDTEILDAMTAGTLRVDDETLAVEKYHPTKRRWLRVSERQHPKDRRITFKLKVGQRQRTIYRNKLVWMWVHRRLVPDGLHIDHENGDSYDDRPGNLRLRDALENSLDNTHSAMRELSEYFLLAELGFDPNEAYPPCAAKSADTTTRTSTSEATTSTAAASARKRRTPPTSRPPSATEPSASERQLTLC